MKRLCVFYVWASLWWDKPVEWIICKRCQRKIRRHGLGRLFNDRGKP